jgi:predicted AlkP superfamily pyrophosphatase or phosphodiesterase
MLCCPILRVPDRNFERNSKLEMKPTVILAAIDGLRAEALSITNCPNLEQLRKSGAFSLNARSVVPSITLPCFLSIFHSIPPQLHGTMHNTWVPMARPVPGLVETLRSAGKKAAFFYNWEPLRNLNLPLHLSFSYFIDNLDDIHTGDFLIVEQALRCMSDSPWDFIFIYLGTLDVVGHKHGFMSPDYLKQLEHLDKAVGMLLDSIPQETFLLLLSDHGGHDRTHGTESPEDMIIPWFMHGPNVRKGYELQTPPSLLDAAPTIVRILNVPAPTEWEGKYIAEAFLQEVSNC